MGDQLLSRRDVADLLGVPPKTLAVWAYEGRGPAYFKVGRHVRYTRTDVELWLDQQRVDPSRRRG
jgi:excisionase family DNA binding protein